MKLTTHEKKVHEEHSMQHDRNEGSNIEKRGGHEGEAIKTKYKEE